MPYFHFFGENYIDYLCFLKKSAQSHLGGDEDIADEVEHDTMDLKDFSNAPVSHVEDSSRSDPAVRIKSSPASSPILEHSPDVDSQSYTDPNEFLVQDFSMLHTVSSFALNSSKP